MTVKRRQGPEDLEDLSFEKRAIARQWARDNGLGHLEGLEEHPDPAAPTEREGCVFT